MKKIIINATLTTVQPVSIKLPDQDGHPKMTRGVDSEGQPKKTAYIPATTVRGKLRRLAVQPLMQAAADAGKPWTLHQVYEAMLGQDAASEASEEIDLIALKKRRADNHIVDLFGAGLGVKSRLSVGHFMPVVDVAPEAFAGVRKDLDSDTDVLALMDPDEVNRFVDRNTNNSKRSAAQELVKKMTLQVRKTEKAGQDVTDLKANGTYLMPRDRKATRKCLKMKDKSGWPRIDTMVVTTQSSHLSQGQPPWIVMPVAACGKTATVSCAERNRCRRRSSSTCLRARSCCRRPMHCCQNIVNGCIHRR